MNDTPRPPLVLRNVNAQAPSKLLARPTRHAAHAPSSIWVAESKPQQPLPIVSAETSVAAQARGHQEGYDAGVREGLKEAQRQVAEHLEAQVAKLEAQAQAQASQLAQEHSQRVERLDQLLNGLEAAVGSRLDHLEPQAAALAFEAVCKLLGNQAAHADTLVALIQQAARQIRNGTLLSIKLHPADLAALAGCAERPALEQQHPGVQWETDARATRGSCTLVTDRGALDAGLFTQLELLRKVWSHGASE
jgi:flagellar assembly protein FliH